MEPNPDYSYVTPFNSCNEIQSHAYLSTDSLHVSIGNSSYYFPKEMNGKYRYTQDLLQLSQCTPGTNEPQVPEGLLQVVTPLKPDAWAEELMDMPDKQLVQYLIKGMNFGFRIGFNRRCATSKAKANMRSALENPEPVHKFIYNELQAHRIAGPFNPNQFPETHISRFGVIPKRDQPGKWRLILDLSSPEGHSVNDGIEPDMCSLKYSSVDAAAEIIAHLGQGALLAKIDIAHAYRNIPVHPQDRHLLGMMWDSSKRGQQSHRP